MSNIINFLERLGQDAGLRHATIGEIANALVEAGIQPKLLHSIFDVGDQKELEILLGAKPNVFCGIAPAIYDEVEAARVSDEAVSDCAVTAL